MKKNVNVSLIQFNSKVLEPEKNAERMREFALSEAVRGTKLIVFPELANIGYVEPAIPGDPVFLQGMSHTDFASRYVKAAETIPGPTSNMFTEIAQRFETFIVVGLAQRHPLIPATIYNSAVLIGPGGILGVYHKVHLWHLEKLFFYPGNSIHAYDTGLGKIGMQICYDIRFPEITRILALKGAEIVCSIWASFYSASIKPTDFDIFKHRSYTRAQENGLFFLTCNRAGTQGANSFFGRSVIASPNGSIIAASQTGEEEVIRGELDEDELINYRSTVNIFIDRRPDLYKVIVGRGTSACSSGNTITKTQSREYERNSSGVLKQRQKPITTEKEV